MTRLIDTIPVLTGTALAGCSAPGVEVTLVEHRADVRLDQHRHREAVIGLLMDGAYEERMDGRLVQPGPATVLLKPPETPHSNTIGRSGSHTILIQIAPESLAALSAPGLHDAGIHVDARVCRIGEDMLRELRQADQVRPLGLDALIAELLALIGERGQWPGRGYAPAQSWIGLVRDRLHDEPARTLTLDELARLAGVHRAHVAKGFRAAFGCTIGEYLRALRVRELARRLRAEHTPLARLAVELGFYDQPHLTRRFRAAYGMTPLAYRSLHADQPR